MLLIAGMSVSACQREVGDGPYEISGRLFVFNYRLSYATYLVTLKRIGEVKEGLQFRARFADPAGGDELVAGGPLFPAQAKVSIESPHLTCVRKSKPYAVTIEIIDQNGKLVQQLQTSVTSDLDQSILPEKPMVVGPAYQRNGEAFDNQGRPLPGSMQGCPAN